MNEKVLVSKVRGNKIFLIVNEQTRHHFARFPFFFFLQPSSTNQVSMSTMSAQHAQFPSLCIYEFEFSQTQYVFFVNCIGRNERVLLSSAQCRVFQSREIAHAPRQQSALFRCRRQFGRRLNINTAICDVSNRSCLVVTQAWRGT
jgi:hypothetical protein